MAIAVGSLLLATTVMTPLFGATGLPSRVLAAPSSSGPHFEGNAAESRYPVSVIESGLAVGGAYSVVWGISITGGLSYSSTLGTITFYLPNGTYQYSTHSSDTTHSAPPGSFAVRGGPASVYVAYVLVTTEVTFTESGLPVGQSWTVTVDAIQVSSTANSISFPEANGSHSFSVTAVPGFQASPPAGSVMVGGTPLSVELTFTPIVPGIYLVTFRANALAENATWTIVLDGATENVIGPALEVSEANGSYSFTVLPPQGYHATPASGTVVVHGSSVSVPIEFTVISTGGSSGISGFDLFWTIFVSVAVAIAAISVGWVLMRRRGPPKGF